MNIILNNTKSYTTAKKENLVVKRAVLEYQKAKINAETIKKEKNEKNVYENKMGNR